MMAVADNAKMIGHLVETCKRHRHEVDTKEEMKKGENEIK